MFADSMLHHGFISQRLAVNILKYACCLTNTVGVRTAKEFHSSCRHWSFVCGQPIFEASAWHRYYLQISRCAQRIISTRRFCLFDNKGSPQLLHADNVSCWPAHNNLKLNGCYMHWSATDVVGKTLTNCLCGNRWLALRMGQMHSIHKSF